MKFSKNHAPSTDLKEIPKHLLFDPINDHEKYCYDCANFRKNKEKYTKLLLALTIITIFKNI